MSEIKKVRIDSKYKENISDLEHEETIVNSVLENTFNKFMNEENYNNLDYALTTLLGKYVYIENDYLVPQGKYIRYLDLRDTTNIKLRIGGFVLNDNGYSVSIKGFKKCIKFSKKNVLIFIQLTDTDFIKHAVQDYI